jgi:hypothetical protein
MHEYLLFCYCYRSKREGISTKGDKVMFYITLVETNRVGDVLQVYHYGIEGGDSDWRNIERSAEILMSKLKKPGEIWHWKWSPTEPKKMKIVYTDFALEEAQ